jgi:hypothetical protein
VSANAVGTVVKVSLIYDTFQPTTQQQQQQNCLLSKWLRDLKSRKPIINLYKQWAG